MGVKCVCSDSALVWGAGGSPPPRGQKNFENCTQGFKENFFFNFHEMLQNYLKFFISFRTCLRFYGNQIENQKFKRTLGVRDGAPEFFKRFGNITCETC